MTAKSGPTSILELAATVSALLLVALILVVITAFAARRLLRRA